MHLGCLSDSSIYWIIFELFGTTQQNNKMSPFYHEYENAQDLLDLFDLYMPK